MEERKEGGKLEGLEKISWRLGREVINVARNPLGTGHNVTLASTLGKEY